MYKETKYIFTDRPHYQININKEELGNNIYIKFQLEKDDDFVIEITQNQAIIIINQLANYVGKKVVNKELKDYESG